MRFPSISSYQFFWSCLIVSIGILGCKEKPRPGLSGSWHYIRSFPLHNVDPISITGDANHLFISSGLRTEVHKYNYDGGLVEQIKNIRKPKYLNILNTGVFVVAESEAHVASRVAGQEDIRTIPTNEHLNIPFGVSVEANFIAITDLDQQKVYFNAAGAIRSFGSKGTKAGQFEGPTDIQIKNKMIYVADSRNGRVQVFDSLARHIRTIGQRDTIRSVGGLYITADEIAVTDYTGNRLLIYDLNGKLKQDLRDQLDTPSDVFIRGRELFVVNYSSNTVTVFDRW
jgi:hypothetical protein